MGRRGPPKTPAAVLKCRQTFRKDRHSDDVDASVKAAMPQPPAHLDETARAAWKKLGPKLVKAGLLTELDGMGMEVLCQAYSGTVDTTRLLAEGELIVYVGENATPMANPLVGIIAKNLATLKWALTQFGLTPASRTGIRTGKDKDAPADPMAALMSGE